MARLILENVSKVFDDKITAVDNMTLNVANQEFMVIVGPSGCGKTTTLRMIAGLEEITKGTIKISDKIVNDIPPKDRDIAMVFQNYALYPHMTIYQNLAFGLKLRKYPKAEIRQRVGEVVKMLGVEQLLNRKPKALSGGQRQRVALGRAIVRHPKVFLFDEPLSNLDVRARVATRTELKRLHQKLRTTSIYVTHDQVEAMTLGDRICVLYNGIIQQVASPLEIYDKPANRFVAGFFGILPMNFLDGLIQCENDNIYFVTSSEIILLPSRMKNLLADYKDRKMVLGIRPEHISLQPVTNQKQNTINCVTVAIEPLGDQIGVHLESTSKSKLTVAVNPHTNVHINQRLILYLNVEEIHVFEPGETGRNVSLIVLLGLNEAKSLEQ